MNTRDFMKLIAILLATSCTASSEEISEELLPPQRVLVAGWPIDVEREGHSAPFFGDIDGDGLRDLLVGQYYEGKLRVYRNVGEEANPLFDDFSYLRVAGKDATVPYDRCIGFTPQLVDLDQDGQRDIISGSWPGEI